MAALEYLTVIRRRWRVVLACFLVAVATGYVLSPAAPAEPEGSGYLSSLTLVPAVGATQVPNLYLAAHLATTPDVAELAAQRLAEAGVEPEGVEAITSAVDAEVGAVTITATDLDPARASVVARAYADATIAFLQRITTGSDEQALATAQDDLKEIERSIEGLQDDLADDPNNGVLQARLNTEQARYGIAYNRVQELIANETVPLQVLGTPEVEQLDEGFISPPSDRRVRALLAGVLGIVLGLGFALVVDRLDTRLRERDDVEEALGLPVLGEIPRVSRRARADYALVTAVRPDGAAAEAYRSLRSAITLVAQGRRTEGGMASARTSQQTPQVLVVTGMQSDEGKTTTVVNLATALAETDRSVLVIDCDFRKPEAHLYLKASPSGGLADVFEADVAEEFDLAIRSTTVRRVQLLTSGEPVHHPASVLARLSGIIVESRARADVVLIDSSPLLVASDAVDVLQYADAALVACRLGRTTYEQARRARRLLQRANVPVLGIVLTGTAPTAATPYGQTSRKRAFWSRLAAWAHSVGPSQASRESPAAAADETPEWRADDWPRSNAQATSGAATRQSADVSPEESAGGTARETPAWPTGDWRRTDAARSTDEQVTRQPGTMSPNGTVDGTGHETPTWRAGEWRRTDAAGATDDEEDRQPADVAPPGSRRVEQEGEG